MGLISCDETRYFHHEGNMAVNKKEGKIFGVIIVEQLKDANLTHIAGMYVVDNVHTPFHISGKFTSIQNDANGSIIINMTAYEGSFGGKNIKKLTGGGVLAGTWNVAKYTGNYHSSNDKLTFEFVTSGTKHPCEYYSMEEASRRAAYLVGESHGTYKNNHLLNHAVFGFAYLKTTCDDYLKKVGTAITKEKPGAVIVGNDGKYCAIVDHEGNKFIHSDESKKKIVMTPMAMINNYFKHGYTMKEYKCDAGN